MKSFLSVDIHLFFSYFTVCHFLRFMDYEIFTRIIIVISSMAINYISLLFNLSAVCGSYISILMLYLGLLSKKYHSLFAIICRKISVTTISIF